jgi:hypothetical protein
VRACAYRETSWLSSHLRTFYAVLIKQIHLKDFLEKGKFYGVSCDIAMMFPLLALSAGKSKFIDTVLYQYNCATGLNDFKKYLQYQLHINYVVRGKEKYKPAQTYDRTKKKSAETKAVDVLIFSSTTDIDSIDECVNAVQRYASGIGTIYVCKVDSKYAVLNACNRLNTEYCLVLIEDNILCKSLSLAKCAQLLYQTGAVGWYGTLGKNAVHHAQLSRAQNIPPVIELQDGIWAWQFKYAERDWVMPYNINMSVLKTADLCSRIQGLNFNSVGSLSDALSHEQYNTDDIGLCFID